MIIRTKSYLLLLLQNGRTVMASLPMEFWGRIPIEKCGPTWAVAVHPGGLPGHQAVVPLLAGVARLKVMPPLQTLTQLLVVVQQPDVLDQKNVLQYLVCYV